MFSFFKKSPLSKLKKEYAYALEQAMQAQRNGDIRGYAQLNEQAELVLLKITELEKESEQ